MCVAPRATAGLCGPVASEVGFKLLLYACTTYVSLRAGRGRG
jgi:hypothetical protein